MTELSDRAVETARPNPPVSASRARRGLASRLLGINEFGILATLLVLILIIGIPHPDFMDQGSLTNIGEQSAFFGILALGMVYLLSMREIDLSVGSLYGLSIVGSAVLIRDGLSPWIGALVAIGIGVLGGLINAALSIALRIPTIIATLGTLSMYKGLSLVVSNSQTVSGLPRDNSFFTVLGADYLGIPAVIWAFAILTVILHVMYRRSRFGFMVRAVGSNPDAAAVAGIPIDRVRTQALVLTGGLCGLCGALTLAFFESADPGLGTGFEILVIAAAIIGGTALAGGVGSVVGAAIGALVIGTIRSGLVQFGITSTWSQFATGAVIVSAVALDSAIRRRRAGAR